MMLNGLKFAAGVVLAGVLLVSCNGDMGKPPISDSDKEAQIDDMYRGYRDEFPDVQEISADELAQIQTDADVMIVDVRESDERAISMIPGAISTSEFEEQLDEASEKRIIVYCTIGYRSGLYVKELQEKGVDASNLTGSILSWTHAGQPVVDGEGRETNRVHVYGKQWNLLPEGMEGIW